MMRTGRRGVAYNETGTRLLRCRTTSLSVARLLSCPGQPIAVLRCEVTECKDFRLLFSLNPLHVPE